MAYMHGRTHLGFGAPKLNSRMQLISSVFSTNCVHFVPRGARISLAQCNLSSSVEQIEKVSALDLVGWVDGKSNDQLTRTFIHKKSTSHSFLKKCFQVWKSSGQSANSPVDACSNNEKLTKVTTMEAGRL